MAENISMALGNFQDIFSSAFSTIADKFQNQISIILTLSKILLIVMLIYFIILIIAKIFRIRESMNMKNISIKVSEIDDKMSLLLEKKRPARRREQKN